MEWKMKNKLLKPLCIVFSLVSLQATAATLYLVRHAEKQNMGADPELTACGKARAEALATYFTDIELAAVYTTPYQRTQQTAMAVAMHQQLKVSLYDARDPAALIAQLRTQSQPALIVGHSNTVPQLVSMLSGIEMAPLSEQDFGLLYQLELGEDASVTIRRQAFRCEE
jgi:2,3-bisphosphoglycerate-dependent phosphoglycerate mutase